MTSDDFWQFPTLAERQMRQIRTLERNSGLTTVARACTITNTYCLVRFMPSEIDSLSKEERRFVDLNITPAEFTANQQKEKRNGKRSKR